MNRLSAIAGFVLLSVATVWFSACKTGKKAAKTKAEATKVKDTVRPVLTSGITPEKQKLMDDLATVWNRDITYNTFSGKAKMHYETNDNKQDFTANVRIQNGKVIWASITALGGIVQVARIYITPDSFKLVNYLEKTATIMPLMEAQKLLPTPVDFSILQNLIVGNVLSKSNKLSDAMDFKDAWTLQAENETYVQQVSYAKVDSTITNQSFRDKRAGGPLATIQYGSYALQQGRKFSFGRVINLTNAGKQHYIDMNFNSAEFDKALDLPFSIPKNYVVK